MSDAPDCQDYFDFLESTVTIPCFFDHPPHNEGLAPGPVKALPCTRPRRLLRRRSRLHQNRFPAHQHRKPRRSLPRPHRTAESRHLPRHLRRLRLRIPHPQRSHLEPRTRPRLNHPCPALHHPRLTQRNLNPAMTKNHEFGSWARNKNSHAQDLTRCIVQLAILAGPEHADTVGKHLNEPLPEPGALAAQKEHWVRTGRKGHSL